MKLHLSINGTPQNGYKNIDPFPQTADGLTADYGDLDKLDKLVDDAEADEIWVDNVLNYIADYDIESYINHWLSKLRHGGTIHFDSTDLYSIALAVHTGSLTGAEARYLLYGVRNVPSKLSSYEIGELERLLGMKGLKIVRKSCNDFVVTVTALRE